MSCDTRGRRLCWLLAAAVACLWTAEMRAAVVDFEDLGATLAPEGYFNGKTRFDATGEQDGTFTSGGLTFNNHYDEDFGAIYAYWDNFAYSNRTFTPPPTEPPLPDENKFVGGQFHARAGSGADGSATYGVGYAGSFGRTPTIDIPDGETVQSVMVTNTNYTYYTMLEGDFFGFTDRFGGPSLDEPDWLLLTITGKDEVGAPVGSVDFYLADYRPTDNALDYLVDEWTQVDLSSLAGARALEFSMDSSDVGPYGINTPTFFAIDNIVLDDGTGGGNGGGLPAVPEPATYLLALLGGCFLLATRAGRRRSR